MLFRSEDEGALLGSQVALFNQSITGSAYREGTVGMIAGVKTMMSQVVPTFVAGAADNTTPVVDGDETVNTVSYDTAKNTWSQTLVTDGWDPTSTAIPVGTVFTIADVYMVNPKTKANTGILQQFVVTAAATTNANAASASGLRPLPSASASAAASRMSVASSRRPVCASASPIATRRSP